jgi:hypothetical protein
MLIRRPVLAGRPIFRVAIFPVPTVPTVTPMSEQVHADE